MPRRRGRRGAQQAANVQGGGHEQQQQQEQEQQQAVSPPILQSLTPTEQGNNNHHHQQQQQQKEQEQEHPPLSTSILLGLATKAAAAAKEAQEAARTAGKAAQAAVNAAAEAAQASQIAADAAAMMAEALQQLQLQEECEKEKEAARLMALQQERQKEAWDVCVSTRMLSSFLNRRDLGALSSCSHLHLPVRRQMVSVKVVGITPSLLSSMAAGNLAEVKSLEVDSTHHGFTTHKEFGETAQRAFQQMHNLDRLDLSLTPSGLYCIFEGLGVEGKRRIKTLKLGIIWERRCFWLRGPFELPELPDSYETSFLQGFTSVEHFVFHTDFGESYGVIKNAIFPQLERAMFLKHLSYKDLNDFQHLMLHGNFRQVSFLAIVFTAGDGVEVVEALLPLLPRLRYLCIRDENHTWDAAALERLVARAAEDKCSLCIPGYTHLWNGSRVM